VLCTQFARNSLQLSSELTESEQFLFSGTEATQLIYVHFLFYEIEKNPILFQQSQKESESVLPTGRNFGGKICTKGGA
jgi:hypothetical protein